MITKDYEFMGDLFKNLITGFHQVNIVDFVTANRMLPINVTRLPGPYSFDVFPYHEEILQCLDPSSTVRDVTVMKGVQTGFTTIAENVAFYYAVSEQGTPIMWTTAQLNLAEERRDANIIPMINESGFADSFSPLDENNKRGSGKGRNVLYFKGGSHLMLRGGGQKSVNTARQQSARVLILDESSAFGKNDTKITQGNILELFKARTAAFWDNRKILSGSTPLTSPDPTHENFINGDRRYYNVACLGCGEHQVLRFDHKKGKKKIGGLVWDTTEDGELITDSVRYQCLYCGHLHSEYDKTKLFSKENAYWKPENPMESDEFRSYHLSALYSPANFQPWYRCVHDYLVSYDQNANKPKDRAKYQVFVNNILGEVFTSKTSPIKSHMISSLRRDFYEYIHDVDTGRIPNNAIKKYNNGNGIAFIVATADVHDQSIFLAVWGFTGNNCAYLLKYITIAGSVAETNIPWEQLEKELNKSYISDDGYSYRINYSGIDSGHLTQKVYGFCEEFNLKYSKEFKTIFPIKGFGEGQLKNVYRYRSKDHKSISNIQTLEIQTHEYKDILADRITNEFTWDGVSVQDRYTLNLPMDTTDKQIKQLSAEKKRMKIVNGKADGMYWHRSGANELWDLLVYAQAVNDHIVKSIADEMQHYDKTLTDPTSEDVFNCINNNTLGLAFRSKSDD